MNETYLPHIDANGAALIVDLAAQVGFDVTVETEHQPQTYGFRRRVRALPGRNTEIILYAGNPETRLADDPQAQALEVLDVLDRHLGEEYRDLIAARTYRDGTAIDWAARAERQIATAAASLRAAGVDVSDTALGRAADFLIGLHLAARDQDKGLRGINAAAVPVLAWKALAFRSNEYLTFTLTEVVRHEVDLSYAELDRTLPGWEHFLKGRVSAEDAPTWRAALTKLADGWIGEESQRGRHLGIDDVDVHQADLEERKPFWIPFYG